MSRVVPESQLSQAFTTLPLPPSTHQFMYTTNGHRVFPLALKYTLQGEHGRKESGSAKGRVAPANSVTSPGGHCVSRQGVTEHESLATKTMALCLASPLYSDLIPPPSPYTVFLLWHSWSRVPPCCHCCLVSPSC
ncbi:hypothetical protein Pmani_038373 [Petrolisthes manimaculis]|uniref:Uncharacterized protein n=1 Tax=Petrolisthes manimaculis TaxID=1843537 RepID=A0AAE1TKK7_9EUCA|nr:hypothetical protein Pmani_038373 [Petrolisthes manimaculis]